MIFVVLLCTARYYFVLQSTSLYYAVLLYTRKYQFVLRNTTLYYRVPVCTTPYYCVLRSTRLYYRVAVTRPRANPSDPYRAENCSQTLVSVRQPYIIWSNTPRRSFQKLLHRRLRYYIPCLKGGSHEGVPGRPGKSQKEDQEDQGGVKELGGGVDEVARKEF